MKTQVQMLQDSINKTQEEKFIIFESGEKCEGINYIVINEESKKGYKVTTDGQKVTSCDCPHHKFRGMLCKHMIKVSIEKELNIF